MAFGRLRIAPPVAAGALVGLAVMLLLDGVVTAQAEEDAANRTTFLVMLPAVFSMVGFFLIILSSPVEVLNDVPRDKAVLLLGWMVCFGSSIGALVFCWSKYTGPQKRERSVLGVALVGFTSLTPLAGAILWWGKRSLLDDY